jgi:hypothetical protein
MSTRLKPEVAPPTFQSGDSRPLAVLADEPETLSQRFGLRFAEGIDDLDQFRFAVVNLGGKRQAWLYKHQNDPNPGTVVRVDSGMNLSVARRELARRLSLEGSDVLWWSES